MDKQAEIIGELLRITKLIHSGLVAEDMDIVIEMLAERAILIKLYQTLEKRELIGSEHEKVEKFMTMDKENIALLEALMEKTKDSVDEANLHKMETKKRNKVAKRYLTDGQYLGNYSSFNKKT